MRTERERQATNDTLEVFEEERENRKMIIKSNLCATLASLMCVFKFRLNLSPFDICLSFSLSCEYGRVVWASQRENMSCGVCDTSPIIYLALVSPYVFSIAFIQPESASNRLTARMDVCEQRTTLICLLLLIFMTISNRKLNMRICAYTHSGLLL